MTNSDPTPPLDGRYQILETLGSGGMASVFRGIDLPLKRPVAIKLLREEHAGNEELRRRLEREARAMARLDHANVVKVFDCSLAKSASPYIITELVEGTDLARALVDGGPLPWELALWVVERCLGGLAAIHAGSMIHRDIKPSNILVDDEGVPKIADLGIAHFHDLTGITREGAAPGTLQYMPPEAFEAGPATPQQDVYAMGCVLYELIAGRPPFCQDTVPALINQIIKGSYIPLRRQVPEVGSKLSTLVDRALATELPDRYSSAERMRSDCRAILQRAGARDLSDQSEAWFDGDTDRGWLLALRQAGVAPAEREAPPVSQPSPVPPVAATSLPPAGPAATPPAAPNAAPTERTAAAPHPTRPPAWALPVSLIVLLAAGWLLRSMPGSSSTTRVGLAAAVGPTSSAAAPTPVLPGKLRVEILDERVPVEGEDGAQLGLTGRPISLPAGVHVLILRPRRFEEISAEVTIHPGEVTVWRPALRRLFVPVGVNTSPPGAEILLNGEAVGKVSEVRVPAGELTRLSAQLVGYKPSTIAITAEAGQQRQVDMVLAPDPARAVDSGTPAAEGASARKAADELAARGAASARR